MRIALVGDIALFGNSSLKGNPQILEGLREVTDYLSGFDYVIGNLETPFSIKKRPSGAKSGYLCSDPADVKILKALNVSAVSIANNHLYDFGKEGVETTVRTLDEAGIPWFGMDGKDFRIEGGGNRIAVSGMCCYTTNPQKISSRYGSKGLNRIHFTETAELLRKNHEAGWLNILSVHSGIEHVNRPSADQIRLTRKLAETAPYVWHGHHPHAVQGTERYRDSVIAHSLGNFVFSEHPGDRLCPKIEFNEENRTGKILELTLEGNKITGYRETTTRINEDGSVSILSRASADKYDDMLAEFDVDESAYTAKRNEQRQRWLIQRKGMRDLRWVMKRLRPRYFRLLWDYRNNSKKYHRDIKRHLT